jgi:uncharacterized protein (DUF1330 family)
MRMAKAYWVATYRSISDPEALAGYAKLAGPAISAAGGRFLARGTAAKAAIPKYSLIYILKLPRIVLNSRFRVGDTDFLWVLLVIT